jgi:hypothetical protein
MLISLSLDRYLETILAERTDGSSHKLLTDQNRKSNVSGSISLCRRDMVFLPSTGSLPYTNDAPATRRAARVHHEVLLIHCARDACMIWDDMDGIPD